MQSNPIILCQPPIVKPLHGLNPRSIKGQKWWDVERKKAYSSTNYHCLACGVHKSKAKKHQRLEAHEDYDIDFSLCRYTLKRIIPLCHYCHNFIHIGRLGALFEKGVITEKYLNSVILHGEGILSKNGLDKELHILELAGGDVSLYFPEEDGTWGRWHLLFEDKLYYSLYQDYENWFLHYKNID